MSEETLIIKRKTGKYSSSKVHQRTVLVVGTSGSGKSSMINNLKNYGENKELIVKPSPMSVTIDHMNITDSIEMLIKEEKYVITYIDTRGLADSYKHFEEMRDDWNKAVKEKINEIHYVLIVLPIDRISLHAITEINKMMRFLFEWGCKVQNVLMVINKVDFLSEERINGYLEDLKKVKFDDSYKACEVLTMCSPEFSELRTEYQLMYYNEMVGKIDAMIERLIRDVKPFRPKLMQLEKEEREHQREIAVLEKKLEEEKAKWKCTIM